MPETDDKLSQALRLAKTAPMFFAFVAKGSADGALIVSKKEVTGGELAAAKAKLGGGTIFRGRCFGEDGTTVFEMSKEPPGTLANQLKRVISRDAGLSLKVETRLGAGDENEETEGQETTGPTAETFKARLKAVSPVYLEAAKKAPDRKPGLDKIAGDAAAAYRGGDFATSLTLLDQLETTSREILDVATITAPEPKNEIPPAPPPPPPPTADANAFRARLKEVSLVYQQATQKVPEKKADLDKIAALAAASAKAADYVTAIEQLGRLETASKEALATPPPQPTTTDEAATFKTRLREVSPLYQDALKAAPDQKATLDGLAGKAAGAAKAKNYAEAMKRLDELEQASQQILAPPTQVDASSFKARMKEVLPVYQEACQKAPDRKSELDKLANQAAAAAKEGNYAGALDLLDQLEARSKGAVRQAEAVKDVNLASPVRRASFHKARDQWNQARALARAQIQKLAQTILADPEAKAQPDWDDIRTAADSLADQLDAFDASLGDAVARAASDDPNDRDAGLSEARNLIAAYRKDLDTNGLFKLTDGDAYGNFNVAKVLSLALDAVDKRLAT